MSINQLPNWQQTKTNFSDSNQSLAGAMNSISRVGDTFSNISDKMEIRAEKEELKHRQKLFDTAKTLDVEAYSNAFDENGKFNPQAYQQNLSVLVTNSSYGMSDDDISSMIGMLDVKGTLDKGNQWNMEQDKFNIQQDAYNRTVEETKYLDEASKYYNDEKYRNSDRSYNIPTLSQAMADGNIDPSTAKQLIADAEDYNLRLAAFNRAQTQADNEDAFNSRVRELTTDYNSNRVELTRLNNIMDSFSDNKNSEDYLRAKAERDAFLQHTKILSPADMYDTLALEGYSSTQLKALKELKDADIQAALMREQLENIPNTPYKGTKTYAQLAKDFGLSDGNNTWFGHNSMKDIKALGNMLISNSTNLSEEDIASFFAANIQTTGEWTSTSNKVRGDIFSGAVSNGALNFDNPLVQQFSVTYFNSLKPETKKQFLEYAKLSQYKDATEKEQQAALNRWVSENQEKSSSGGGLFNLEQQMQQLSPNSFSNDMRYMSDEDFYQKYGFLKIS